MAVIKAVIYSKNTHKYKSIQKLSKSKINTCSEDQLLSKPRVDTVFDDVILSCCRSVEANPIIIEFKLAIVSSGMFATVLL